MAETLPLSIVIPTYGRDEILVHTIEQLLSLQPAAAQILVVDQTPQHDQASEQRLAEWHRNGGIVWLRREEPSITKAMNAGLRAAEHPYVLFLDDDIRPYENLVSGHYETLSSSVSIWGSVGQVIQPWQQPTDLAPPRLEKGLRRDFDFPFHSTQPADVANVMAGNLCVKQTHALAIGGFDENFVGVAYRFETDFARRLIAGGGTIRFTPASRIDHLRVDRGGTRQTGSHLTSIDPIHGVGDYYYALRHGSFCESLRYSAYRMFREVCTRFHLAHPWWIPVKWIGEARAWAWAIRLQHRSTRATSTSTNA